MTSFETHNIANPRVAAINYNETRKTEHDDSAQVDVIGRQGSGFFNTAFVTNKERFRMTKMVLENKRTELESIGQDGPFSVASPVQPTPRFGRRLSFNAKSQAKGGNSFERFTKGVTKSSVSELVAPTPVEFRPLAGSVTLEDFRNVYNNWINPRIKTALGVERETKAIEPVPTPIDIYRPSDL